MRYCKLKNAGYSVHVWLTRIHLEPEAPISLPEGVAACPRLPTALSGLSDPLLRKTVFWLDEASDTFGIWGARVGFCFPADKLVYIEMVHESTFRGTAICDRLRIDSLLPTERPELIHLGLCTPARPVRKRERNRELVCAELLKLDKTPLFQSRFENTVRFTHCDEPY